jgi:hypothetical protein
MIRRKEIAKAFGVKDKTVDAWLYRGLMASRDLRDVIHFAIEHPKYGEKIKNLAK